MESTVPKAPSFIAMLTATAVLLVLVGGASLEPSLALPIEETQVQPSTVLVDEAPALGVLPNAYSGFDPEDSDLVDRDEYANTYQNSDGTFTDVVSYEPINVRHGGQWVPASDAISHDASGWSADFHPMSPEFANRANGGMTASHGGSEITFRLNGVDNSRINRVLGTDDAVQYDDVIGGADLRYDTEGAAVKETIVLNEAPELGGTRWTWDISAPELTMSKNEFGDIEFVDADGVVQFHIPQPVAWDSSGIDEVQEPASITLGTQIVPSGQDYKLIVTVDPQWIFDRARVYPVFIDPSVTAGDTNFRAYKSDGATRTDAVHVGNSRDSGTNKYWRTQAKYSYSGLSGKQVIDASFKAVYVNGTVNAYAGGGIYEAPCLGYSCVGAKLGNVTVGSGNDVVNTNKLAEYYAAAVDTGNFGRYLTSRGAETAGVYTYKQLNTSLTLTYKAFPSISGMNGDSPSDGGIASLTPSLSVAAFDPTGDGVEVRYLVSDSPNFDETNAIFVSDWMAPGPINLADSVVVDPGVTYFWKAQVKDAYDGLYGISTLRLSSTWSFTTIDSPPATPTFSSVRPAAELGGNLLVGIAPTFGFYATDPESAQLQITVEVLSKDGDGKPGPIVDRCGSDFVAQPAVLSCALETGALTDGVNYLVRARTFDGTHHSDWSSSTDVRASSDIVDSVPGFTEKSLNFDHPVSLSDAIDVMSNLNYDVVGYEYENDDLFGAFYPSPEYTASEFLTEFAVDYNTIPEISAVTVLAPAFQAASIVSPGGVDPLSITTNKPEIVAPLANGVAITDFNGAMDAVASLVLPTTGGASVIVADATSPTRWDPGFVNTKILKAGNSLNKKVKFVNYYYWDGKVASPKMIADYKQHNKLGQLVNYYGMEFENNVWGKHWASNDTMKCQAGFCLSYCPNVEQARNFLVARNYGYSYTIRVGSDDYSNQVGPRQIDVLGAYADTDDLWDKCNMNSITIGLQHPEKLNATSSTDPSFRLYISVTTAKGADNMNNVESGIQVVSGATCISTPWLSETACMGTVVTGSMVFPGARNYRPSLARERGWMAPNLCWASGRYGKAVPVKTVCTSTAW